MQEQLFKYCTSRSEDTWVPAYVLAWHPKGTATVQVNNEIQIVDIQYLKPCMSTPPLERRLVGIKCGAAVVLGFVLGQHVVDTQIKLLIETVDNQVRQVYPEDVVTYTDFDQDLDFT